ncbi:hypothetical protein KATP_33500 [Kluyvera ascorbata]|nr:hypothetical protein KATP_33500 [Kluyvera ascorbata]
MLCQAQTNTGTRAFTTERAHGTPISYNAVYIPVHDTENYSPLLLYTGIIDEKITAFVFNFNFNDGGCFRPRQPGCCIQ